MSNLPPDWGSHYTTCPTHGQRVHASGSDPCTACEERAERRDEADDVMAQLVGHYDGEDYTECLRLLPGLTKALERLGGQRPF